MPLVRLRSSLLRALLPCLALVVPAIDSAAQPRGGVTLFADVDFRGAAEAFYDDVPSLRSTSFGQDRASSVRLGTGCTVTLFADVDYRGRSTTLRQNTPTLFGTPVGNDSVSSFRVRCPRTPGRGIDWDRDDGVALYSDAGFDGRREIFRSDDDDLRNNRIGNDAASSLRVAPGCRATLYSEAGYRGRSTTYTNDTRSLSSTRLGNDQASSLRLECDRSDRGDRWDNPWGNRRDDRREDRADDRQHRHRDRWRDDSGATLFADNDYRGRSETFHRDVARLGETQIGNDRASSVRVAPGCRLVLFDHENFRGNSTVLTGDVPSLRETPLGNDRASSLQIDCGRSGYGYGPGDRGGVTLFGDADFRGRSETFFRDVHDLDDTSIGNDTVSSIRVSPGCRAVLYRDVGYRGERTVLTDDLENLRFTDVGNDSISSIEVDCRR